jgi:hypothetical protein
MGQTTLQLKVCIIGAGMISPGPAASAVTDHKWQVWAG